jgi:hypothetical protein
MIKIEHNVETGEIVQHELTEIELQQIKNDQAAIDAKKLAETAKEIAKAALLEKLGITADEAALLLS